MKLQGSRSLIVLRSARLICLGALVGCVVFLAVNGVAALADTPSGENSASTTSTQPYTISSGDQLDISVLNHDEMHTAVTVLPDGTFTYPIAGTIRAAGSTIDDLEKVVEQALAVQLDQPQVTITVAQREVDQIGVLGAVKTPGKIDFKVGWRVLDAVAAAGGLAVEGPIYASASLIRNGASVMPIDLVQVMGDTPDPSQNVSLQPGDVLLITAREQSQVDVQVLGEVATPGFVRVPKDGSLNTVLIEAGGPTTKALLSQAVIERGDTKILVDLRGYVSQGEVPDDVKIEPGDVLVIPRNENQFAVFGAVSSPGYLTFPDDIRPLTVLKALGAAGAPASNANLADVTVVRPATGKVAVATTFDINVTDVLKHGDVAKDMVLQPGDIVYVQSSKHHMSAAEVLQYLNPLTYLAAATKL
jgi:polysaccharide biosynthesis/export protein